MSRFSSSQQQEAFEGRGQKRFSDNEALPTSKRQTLYTETDEADEKDLKRQSVIMPELENYFAAFNDYQPTPKVATDPRKLNNPDDLRRMAKKIDKMLKETDFRPIEFRHIRYLSSKDFKDIFFHLLERVYPDFKLKNKFEDEVPKFLKAIEYPSADLFNSKMFFSIAPHSFYLFLHLLEFMVDNARRMMNHSNQETSNVSMFQNNQVFASEDMPKLYRDFTLIAYGDHLKNEPTDSVVTDIDEIFNILINRKQKDDLELTKDSTSVDETMKTFNDAENKSIQLETTHNSLYSDTEKYIEYRNKKKTKCEKYSIISQRVNEQLRDLVKQSDAVVEKTNQLKEMVKAKGLSLEQVDSMQEQVAHLTAQYANIELKTRETSQEKKAAENRVPEASNTLQSGFVRLRAELKEIANIVVTNSQSDSSLTELRESFNIEDNRIIDYALNMNDDVWTLLQDWSSHYKTHFDSIIDQLHKLKTAIIEKREKYDEADKATQEEAHKAEEQKIICKEKEQAAKAEFHENDRAVALKEKRIDELKNAMSNKIKAHGQEMDTSHAEMTRLEYIDGVRSSKFKENHLGALESLKSLNIAVNQIAAHQESFSVEYIKAASENGKQEHKNIMNHWKYSKTSLVGVQL